MISCKRPGERESHRIVLGHAKHANPESDVSYRGWKMPLRLSVACSARSWTLCIGRVQVWCQTIAPAAITGGFRVFLLLLWPAVTARAVVRTTHKATRTTSQRVTRLLWSFQFFLPPSLCLLQARLSEGGVRFPFSEMLFIGQWRFPVESSKKDSLATKKCRCSEAIVY